MNRRVAYVVLAILALACLPLAVRTAEAQCGGCAALTAGPARPAGVAGPKSAATAPTGLSEALNALDSAAEAVRAGDTKAALAALATARKLVAAKEKFVPINRACPMTGRPVTPSAERVYNGQTIAFCGPGCAAGWDKAPDAKRAEIFAKITASLAKGAKGPTGVYANVVCPIMGGKIDPKRVTPAATRTYHGKKVAFCCPGCPAKWDKLSDEQKAAKLAKAQGK